MLLHFIIDLSQNADADANDDHHEHLFIHVCQELVEILYIHHFILTEMLVMK